MGKIIFLDVDGTIKDFDGTIPKSTVDAIHEARREGNEVCICTGRTYRQIDQDVLDIGFDGIIANSGGYVEYKGECINHRFFTQLAYIELMNDLLRNHCVVKIETKKGVYILRQDLEEYEAIHNRVLKSGDYASKIQSEPIPVDSVLDVPEVEKLQVFSNAISGKEIRQKWGYAFRIVDLRGIDTERWAGEITPIDVNEAKGIRQVLLAGDYDRSDAIAVGDGDNDLEMIRYAKVGVAMEHSSEAVRNAADYITSDVQENGIRRVFLNLGLIKK